MCQALHKSGYSEAQITQKQPQGKTVEAKMAAIKGCIDRTKPDWSDLCGFPHFSVQVWCVFKNILSIIGAHKTFTASV